MQPRFELTDLDMERLGMLQTSQDIGVSVEEEHARKGDEVIGKIKQLPKAAGVVLVTAGVSGLIIPGLIGWPLLFAGGIVLAPKTFGKLDESLKEHLPQFRRGSARTLGRFFSDMEKRYPPTTTD
jgi:hypothetical protein